jgi:tetratricopeptide (TPR) repeat protein
VPELESLRRNLRVQLARAYRIQALCYPEKSVDRVNSLSLALDQLENVLSQPLDDAGVWRARVEQVVCLRLADQQIRAHEQLQRWLQASPPAHIAVRLQGEMLRLLLEGPHVDRARQFADQFQRSSVTAPETDEALLATRLASGQMKQATQQLQHIAATHGAYWKRRAELLLGLAVAAQPDSADRELLNFAAASLYAADRTDEAIAMYDRIAQMTTDQELQFQALQAAAAIVQTSKQPAVALERFRGLALLDPQREQAPKHHLTAVGQAAELLRNAPPEDRGQRFEQYLALLKEHLKQWPAGPSAPKVQEWLSRAQTPEINQQRAETLVNLGKRSEAIALYRQLVQTNPSDGPLCEVYAQLLQQGKAAAELREALRVWQQLEKQSKPGSPRWWRGRRARLNLLKQLGEGEQAEKLKQLTEILYDRGTSD